ncbi:MAG: hypothetical protein JSR36_09695 [Proteobacteria bacterium]|nr:hypothetical protein [Pseudomonadota bacterium]
MSGFLRANGLGIASATQNVGREPLGSAWNSLLRRPLRPNRHLRPACRLQLTAARATDLLENGGDEEVHHEAAVEHAGAKNLIAQIEKSDPEDEYFDAKVSVLMIRHHVKEEESPGGMFAEAKKAKMDLEALGEQLAERKAELEETAEEGGNIAPSGPLRALDSTVLTAS